MGRGNKLNDKAEKIAISKFFEAIQLCSDEAEISRFCQMTLTLSAKTIHGIEGRKFKKDFMSAAIKDCEIITPKKVVTH